MVPPEDTRRRGCRRPGGAGTPTCAAQRPLPPTEGARSARRTPEHGAAAREPRVAGTGPRPRGSQRGGADVAVGGQPSAPCPGATARRGGLVSAGCSRQASKRTRRDEKTAQLGHRGIAREVAYPLSPSPWRPSGLEAAAGLETPQGWSRSSSSFSMGVWKPRKSREALEALEEQRSPGGLGRAEPCVFPGLGFELQ